MAALLTPLHFRSTFNNGITESSIPLHLSTSRVKFCNSTAAQTLIHTINSANTVRRMSVSLAVKRENCFEEGNETARDVFVRWFELIRDVLPGGCWWNLRAVEENVDGSRIVAEQITVLNALREMWLLVADDRWILFIAFGALIVAAVSEISMPGILATSVFSAQNGEMLVFYQNSRLLILLCFTSGICSGLRSGCFAVANMILVQRLRETLYSSLLRQGISFFDMVAVGDLTSRISSDCQRLSQIVGNDIHLILRNSLQGIGAFISLMTLSWPLALSSLAICGILSLIFLIYGQYQKKAAVLAQNFVASSNEVAEETLTLMRIIRAYGTEKEECHRFTQWIEKLAYVDMRASVAYGLWTLSFSTLYRSTQVLAVLFGGTSIMSGDMIRQGNEPGPTRRIVAEPGMRLPGMQTSDAVDADHSSPEFSDQSASRSGMIPDQSASSPGMNPTPSPGMIPDQSASSPGMNPTPSPGMIPDQSASSPGMNIGASLADPEMQLKGPITRLRAKRLERYLQGVLRRQVGITDSGQIFSSSSPHPVNLLTVQPGYIVSPHPASLPSP